MTLPRLVASGRARSVCFALAAGLAMGTAGGLGVALGQNALATVDQIADFSATAASGMFRFAPDLVRIAPGEAITFLNSRGSHTINTQKGLWPEGVPEIDISGQQRAAIVFDHPGLYGVTCRRHGKYGMVMLVAVGHASATADDLARVDELGISKRAKVGFRRLLSELAG